MSATAASAQDSAELKTDDHGAERPSATADTAESGSSTRPDAGPKRSRFAERIAPREGVYARFGGMTTGSGFALGPGYRRYFLDERHVRRRLGGALDQGLQGARRQGALGALLERSRRALDRLPLPRLSAGRLLRPRRRTRAWSTRTNYGDRKHRHHRPRRSSTSLPWLRVGADIGYFNPTSATAATTACRRSRSCSPTSTAPGLAREQPELPAPARCSPKSTTAISRGNPTRGGFYRARSAPGTTSTLEQFDHHRFDAEASQFFPVTSRSTSSPSASASAT